MFERLVENWLTRINEEGYQLPFCHLLQAEGYKVVHLSRHGPAEQGKDVLAIDPNGVGAAFQLKGPGDKGRITQKEWAGYLDQIVRLVELPITHPAIPPEGGHRAFFVTNGELDETVRQEIADRNRSWKQRGHPELEVITKGDLLARFQRLQTDFWPTEPKNVKLLLELFLVEGDGYLDKASLWRLLEIELPFSDENLTERMYTRAVANAGILCAHALAPYLQHENHVAIIEGWTLYFAACLSLAEKHGLAERVWAPARDLSRVALEDAMLRLWEEVRARTDLVEGSPLEELFQRAFYMARLTWVIGLLSVWGLWQRSASSGPPRELVDILRREQWHMKLLTEADVPKFLAFHWLLRRTTATPEADDWLQLLIDGIARENGSPDTRGLPDPYHEAGDVLRHRLVSEDEWDENFAYQSYMLESLVLIYSKRGWRQRLASLWPKISHVNWYSYRPETPWLFYWWNTEDRGDLRIEVPPMRQSWASLKERARSVDVDSVPTLLQRMPEFLLLFSVVCPNRLTPDTARFLDAWVDGLKHINQSS